MPWMQNLGQKSRTTMRVDPGSASGPSPTFGALLIGSYAAGHALPLVGAGFGWEWIGARLDVRSLRAATQTVGGALMLALAGYYGVLA